MTQADEPPYPRGGGAVFIVVTLFLCLVSAFLDRQIVTLLLPSLKADLGVSDTQVSLLQGLAFASAYAIAGLPAGWLVDRSNRRSLICGGVLVWSLATMACGLCATFGQLFVARMAVGLGSAILSPAVASLVADYFLPAQRGRVMGMISAGSPIGTASAMFLGGLLLSALAMGPVAPAFHEGLAPWKVVFFVVGGPGLVVALLVAALKEPPRRTHRAAGVAAVPAADAPEISLGTFFRRRAGLLLLFFATTSSLLILSYSVGAWAPTVLMRVHHLTPREAGAAYGTMLLTCSVAGGVTSGFIADAFVKRWPLSGRMLLPIIALPLEIAVLATFTLADDVAVVIAALAASTFLTAFISSGWTPAIQDLTPNRLRGRTMAVYLLIGNLIGLGGAPTLVALVTDGVFKDEMMLQKSLGVVALSACVTGFLLALSLPRLYARARREG